MKQLLLLSCFLFLPFFLRANDHELGEKLVHRLWTDGQKCPDRLNKKIEKNIKQDTELDENDLLDLVNIFKNIYKNE